MQNNEFIWKIFYEYIRVLRSFPFFRETTQHIRHTGTCEAALKNVKEYYHHYLRWHHHQLFVLYFFKQFSRSNYE